MAVQRINWQRQLRNGWCGIDKDNGDTVDDNNMETTTTTTATMVVGSIGINPGTDTAAVLCQGLTTQGKCSQRERQCQLSGQLASGHHSNDGRGNVVMLAG